MKDIIYILCILFLTSCNNKKEYDLIFIGNIDNKLNGRIELYQKGDKINGQFINLENDKKIELNGVIINDKFEFYEFQDNNISGYFEGELIDGFLKGKWFDKEKTMNREFTFKLKDNLKTENSSNDNKSEPIIEITKSKKEVFLLEDLLKYNSQRKLEEKFGKENVTIETGYYPEGMGEYRYTILFKNTDKEVEFYWNNERKLNGLKGVRLFKKSKWKTKEGITYGTSSSRLEQLNGRPFSFSLTCQDCDAPREIVDWENGKLSKTNIGVTIYPKASIETDNENKLKYYSNHRYAKGTSVIELFLEKK